MPAPPPRFLTILWTLAAVLLAAGWLSTRGEPAAASAQDTIPLADSIAARGAVAVDTVPAIAPATPAASRAGARVAQARADLDTPLTERLISILGIGVMVLLAWLMSVNRRAFPTRIVLWGTALQLVFALIILRTAPGEQFFASSTTPSSSS